MKLRFSFFLLATFLLASLLGACRPGLEENPGDESMPLDSMGRDPCLQGNWEMSNADVNALMAALVPISSLTIPSGTLVMSFVGEDFSYASRDLILRANMPDGYMEAEAAFLFTAKFASQGGNLIFSETIYEAEALIWRAVIDGEVEEMPGLQTVLFPMPGGGPYECSDDMLTVEAVGGTGDTVYLIFFRQP